jgi:hypothetical protein
VNPLFALFPSWISPSAFDPILPLAAQTIELPAPMFKLALIVGATEKVCAAVKV